MKKYLLDTSALLTLRDDEPGADHVAQLLAEAQTGKTNCLCCFISLMEVMYRVWRDEGESAGRLAYEQCLALPLEWVHESPNLLKRAAEIKASHALSLADAWIAASALEEQAVLIHKDPEFTPIPVEQEPLPFKAK
ncbi:MAG: PIN domain-containing protein [Pseudomonadota bacterium]|nr:PIN domain-containing protein [Pseudomonadota bacterium]